MCSTRSGVIEAATLDRLANGQATGSLQACQAAPAFFMRQPVSASTSTRWGLALGTGSARLATATFCAPLGKLASHTETGKAEGLESTGSLAVVRCAAVPGPTRRFMRVALPSA